ncbi:MAG TPA: thioesterase family protein [Burkholderiaceae bacterium]|nr:thioesterase family protein [Burkholderiaceae bacterium]
MSPDLQPGIRFEWRYTVPPRATVPQLFHDTAFCRDMPDVLATGYLVGLMELACTHGIMQYVDWPREQSVGTLVNFSHIAATPPGMTLTIKGEVTAVDGRRVVFRVEAWDGIDKISEGTHERVVIAPDKFNARLAQKRERAAP